MGLSLYLNLFGFIKNLVNLLLDLLSFGLFFLFLFVRADLKLDSMRLDDGLVDRVENIINVLINDRKVALFDPCLLLFREHNFRRSGICNKDIERIHVFLLTLVGSTMLAGAVCFYANRWVLDN